MLCGAAALHRVTSLPALRNVCRASPQLRSATAAALPNVGRTKGPNMKILNTNKTVVLQISELIDENTASLVALDFLPTWQGVPW